MALINTLREKAGKVLVVAVGLAILSFILADLMGPNSIIFGGNSNEVGEIAGRKITYEDFQRRIEDMKNNYMLNTGRNPSEAEMISLRQQAWELLIVDIAFEDQYEELGITVSDEEKIDMVQGNNIHPDLVRAFTNPETGEFDKSQILNFLRNFSQLPPQNQYQWTQMEKSIYQARRRLKYDNLFLSSNFVTDAEAKQQYKMENTTAEVKYLYVPFYAVSDSVITVSDKELTRYLEDHKDMYKVEESRSLKYVAFPIGVSAEDSAYYKGELERLANEFKHTSADSSFARLNSDFGQAYGTYNVSQLPQILQEQYKALKEGEVVGPILEDGLYKLYKVSQVLEDSIYTARASHILFKADQSNEQARKEAKQKAQDALKALRGGTDFATLAKSESEDGSSANGGDLGWFTEGRMVEPFEDAVFSMKDAGLVNKVIETQFGYHVINVTAPKTKEAYKIASIQREIAPSDETRDAAFRKADYFAGVSSDLQDFQENAKKDSLTVLEVDNIAADARRIGSLIDAREVVRWLFRDASKGKISEVFELDDAYVVAVMTGKIDKGTAPLSMVKDEITAKVKNEKKGKVILDKLKQTSGTLEEVASSYGDDAHVYTTADLKLNNNSLPNVGFAPKAVGTALGLKAGEQSAPITAENGVLIIEAITINEAGEIADYSSYKDKIEQAKANRTSFEISAAIKEFADIKDKRYRFY